MSIRTVDAPGSYAPAQGKWRPLGGGRRGSRRPPGLQYVDERLSSLSGLMVAGDLAAAMFAVFLVPPMARGDVTLLAAALVLFRWAFHLYRPRLRLSYLDDVPRAVKSVLAALTATVAIDIFAGAQPHDSTLLWTASTLFVVGEAHRAVSLGLASWSRRRWSGGERALVVGANRTGGDLARAMLEHPEFGLRPVGLLDVSSETGADDSPFPRLEGSLPEIIHQQRVTTVVIAEPVDEAEAVETAILCHRWGCSVLVLPRLFELFSDGHRVERIRSYPLIRLSGDPTRRPTWKIKRLLDVTLAAFALVVFLPLLVVVTIGVRLDVGRSVIFKQERVGLDGRPFLLYKFRTLAPATAREADTMWSIDGDPRVSRFGRLLRRTSIDELPQVWNIVRGDMSLVGPRPERPVFVEEFSALHRRYAARHRVPTGLTGLAQVSGLRGDTSIADRALYDNYYIASWSLWLDVRIMLSTAGELIRHARR